jgi:hypothetical protein
MPDLEVIVVVTLRSDRGSELDPLPLPLPLPLPFQFPPGVLSGPFTRPRLRELRLGDLEELDLVASRLMVLS